MNLLDGLILLVMGLSALVGLWRGAAYEIIALGGWFVAFLLAHLYSPWLADWLARWISQPEARAVLGWLGCFVIVLLASGLLATLVRALLRSTGLGLLDRSLGAVFGVLRGALVVVLLALLAEHTGLPASPLWQGSLLAALAGDAAARVAPMLPKVRVPVAMPAPSPASR